MKKNNNSTYIPTESNTPILQFSVLCDGVANQGNKPVFIGVFSNFVRTGVIPQFFIVNRWIYGKGTFKQSTVIKDPDLKTTIAKTPEQEFTLKEETSCFDIINGFVNTNFSKPGVYWVEISIDGKLITSYPIPVYQMQSP